jgi:hypothetical protein
MQVKRSLASFQVSLADLHVRTLLQFSSVVTPLVKFVCYGQYSNQKLCAKLCAKLGSLRTSNSKSP